MGVVSNVTLETICRFHDAFNTKQTLCFLYMPMEFLNSAA